MLKKRYMRKMLSLFMAAVLLITFAIPASAMGFDDLASEVDVTGNVSDSSASPEDESDQQDDSESADTIPETDHKQPEESASDISDSDPRDTPDYATPTQGKETPPLGASSLSEEELASMQQAMDD